MNILGTFSFALFSLEVRGRKQNSFQFPRNAIGQDTPKTVWQIDVCGCGSACLLPFSSQPFFRGCRVIQAASLTCFPSSLSLLLQTPRPQKCQILLLLLQKFFPPPPAPPFSSIVARSLCCFVEFLPVLFRHWVCPKVKNIVIIAAKSKRGFCQDFFLWC